MPDQFQDFFLALQNSGENNPIDEIEKSRLYYLIGKEIHESATQIENRDALVPILLRAKKKLGRDFLIEPEIENQVSPVDESVAKKSSEPTSQKKRSPEKSDRLTSKKQVNASIRFDKTTNITFLNEIPILFLPVLMEKEILSEIDSGNESETATRLNLAGVRFAQDISGNFITEVEKNENMERLLKTGFSFHKLCGLGKIAFIYKETQVQIEVQSERFNHPFAQHFTLGFIQELFRLVYQKENFNQVGNILHCQIKENWRLSIHIEMASEL